jgi:toxin ParE1/3/4
VKGSIHQKPHAKVDLLQHYVYIGQDNLDAAERFLRVAQEAFEKLSQMPGMGRLRKFTLPELNDVRSWPVRGFENYVIFYRAMGSGIEILRVLHGARDID